MKNQNKYVALLRGINVGGNNIIKMADLRSCFEAMGHTGVATYIQSGNVIFSSPEVDMGRLTTQIEKNLSKRFDYMSKIVVVSKDQLAYTVKKAPAGFGSEPDTYRYDVLFLMPTLTPAGVLNNLTQREGIDRAWKGKQVLYFSRLISKAGQSYLNNLITMPAYQQMTIRNWNTTGKLLELMEES